MTGISNPDTKLIEQQELLYKEGLLVLNELTLLPELKKYGQPLIVGSFELELLTRRDIDIEMIVESLHKEHVKKLCSHLAGLDLGRIDFTVMDNTITKDPGMPNGYYVGIKYIRNETPKAERNPRSPLTWQLDIHFITKEFARGSEKTNQIKERLTPDKRLSMLRIKEEMTSHPKYHKTVFGIDIYDAVLDHGIIDINQFKKYMKEKGVDLADESI